MNHYHNIITVSGDEACQRGLRRLVEASSDRNIKSLRENAECENGEGTTVWSFQTPVTDGSHIASDISAIYPTLHVHIKYQDPNGGVDGYSVFVDNECIENQERDMYEDRDETLSGQALTANSS